MTHLSVTVEKARWRIWRLFATAAAGDATETDAGQD